jgi:translation initiation factor IF-2
MRIYEFSKQFNVLAKDIIDLLRKNGFEIKSHMSVLNEQALDFLTKQFKKQSDDSGPAKKNQPSIQGHVPVKKEIMQEQVQKKIKVDNLDLQQPLSPADIPASKTIIKSSSLDTQEIELKPMTVALAAEKMSKAVNDIIVTLLKWQVIATKNQVLSTETVARLAEHYGLKTTKPVVVDKEVIKNKEKQPSVASENLQDRAPIVVVLGHVDHGKTTLLDFIRKTRVALREKGGITQHLGAYEVTLKQGSIVFLDTPGHEAFFKIRQRGVRIADIAILVVAADDGVMPQTVEAIKQIKTMNIPIIVAINKMDKVDQARLEIIKRQLAQHDVLPEEWGGSAICVPISAKTGMGIDQLLEMIVLQSQMMELRADAKNNAYGYLLETKIEKGRGIIATLICQQGTIHIGDYFTAGKVTGHINVLIDSLGRRINQIGPFVPVQISGFDELPDVGDWFQVVSKQEYLKIRSSHSLQNDLFVNKAAKKENYINLIVKTDNASSREALLESIEKLTKKLEVGFHIVYAGIGNINESDIELAYNTSAEIIGMHIKSETNAIDLARKRNVTITLYDIIYKLLESLESIAQSKRKVQMVRTKIGEAFVRKVFDIPGVGVVAGSYIKDGRFSRDGFVFIWRGKYKVGEGKITSLQRDKKSVKEVHTGFECGFVIDGFKDWVIDDRVECFIEIPKT